jgi:polyphosphate kinase 2 (PPK2 family)
MNKKASRPKAKRPAVAAASNLQQRVDRELADDIDEEFEMELDDDRLARLLGEAEQHEPGHSMDRKLYFSELLRLQGELIKLQDWVVTNKKKVAILFEGRDAAGKGGVIKRITQRLNPRICRPAVKSCCSTVAGTTAPASSA